MLFYPKSASSNSPSLRLSLSWPEPWRLRRSWSKLSMKSEEIGKDFSATRVPIRYKKRNPLMSFTTQLAVHLVVPWISFMALLTEKEIDEVLRVGSAVTKSEKWNFVCVVSVREFSFYFILVFWYEIKIRESFKMKVLEWDLQLHTKSNRNERFFVQSIFGSGRWWSYCIIDLSLILALDIFVLGILEITPWGREWLWM